MSKARLNTKAKNLGLLKFNGTKTELINKIYEIETAKSNRKIIEFFSKVSKPVPLIQNKNKPNNKRLRDDDEEDEDAAVVSRKSMKLL